MIYHVNGILEYCEPGFCVIDVSGLGYKLTISDNTYQAVVGHVNSKEKLLTYLRVSEDGVELFGFKTNDELEAFKLLITVSGVGPKAAMSVLSTLPPTKFSYAVCTEDVKAIAKAPGLGAKTASRIILELKDKFAKEFLGEKDNHISITAGSDTPKKNGKLTEATEALQSLGYDRSSILNALRGLDTEKLSLEEIITQALKKFL